MKTIDHLLSNFEVSGNSIRNINRSSMAAFLGRIGFRTGAEIGVAEGNHARILCQNIPDLRLYCIDAYQHYQGYDEYFDLEKCFEEAKQQLKTFNATFHRLFSMEAVREFPDASLDFVYIDGGHDFKNVANDIFEWSQKVRPGGIVFGHDYKHRAKPHGSRYAVHVKDVVDAYVSAFEIKDFFVLENKIKDPTFGNDNPGWLFVKEEA